MSERCIEIHDLKSLPDLRDLLRACCAKPNSAITPNCGHYEVASQSFCFPNGAIKDHGFITLPHQSIVVPIDPDQNFLLMLQPAPLVKECTLLKFPSGHTDSKACLDDNIHVILERAGFMPNSITCLHEHYQAPDLISQAVDVYIAEDCLPRPNFTPENDESIVYCRVSQALLVELIKANYLKDATTFVAAVKALLYLKTRH